MAKTNRRFIVVGHTEIIIIAGIVLVLFGSTKIPKFFRALGKARNEFEKGAAEASEIADQSTKAENTAE